MLGSNRRGVFIGLILIILVVFAILGVFILSSGTSEYGQTVVVACRLKADAHAQAVLEEAQAVVYDRVCRPYDDDPSDDTANGREIPPWQAELFQDVATAVEAKVLGVVRSYDLLELGLVPESYNIIANDGGAIDECVVDFEGFRRIYYSPTGMFVDSPEVYYKNEHLDPDVDKIYASNDYIGYATVKVKTVYGYRPRVRRHMAATFDVKIINQAPMAREFAAFQWFPVNDATVRDTDLCVGGGLKIFPNDVGRVYALGPYLTESAGVANGTKAPGGDCQEAPRNCPSYWESEWHGWSLLPSARAGIVKGSLFNPGIPPGRPKKTANKRWLIGFIETLLLGAHLSGDLGFYMNDNAQWFCASQDTDSIGDRGFGCVGAPEEGIVQRYRGIQVMYDDNGNRTNEGPFWGGGGWPALGGTEARWVVEPEGNLYQKCKLVRLSWNKGKKFFKLYEKYKLSAEGDFIMRYGTHWMKCLEASFGEVFGEWLMTAALVVLTVVTFGAAGAAAGAWAALGPAAMTWMMGGAAAAIIGGTISILAGTTAYNLGPYALGANAADYANTFPTNHRDFVRTVTRRYSSLDELASYCTDQPDLYPIVLDGTIYVDKFDQQLWFNYMGKGTLMSDNAAGLYMNPVIEGPIMAASDPTVNGAGDLVTMNDHLNLIYLGYQQSAIAGTDLLKVKPHAGGPAITGSGGRQATFIDGSVFSVQGVAPEGANQELTIGGNYSTGYFNKGAIDDSSQLRIQYNPAFAPRASSDSVKEDLVRAFHDGRWHSFSMSYRASGWYDQIRE